MKKYLIYVLMFVLMFSITGCGSKKNIEDKILEKLVEGASDGDVDVDIDKDSIVIKGEEGETISFGNVKWPKSELVSIIPEFTKGNVNGVMEGEDSILITLDSVKKEDAVEYFNLIRKDFAEETYEYTTEDMVAFGGSNGNGYNVSLMYTTDVLTITVISNNN